MQRGNGAVIGKQNTPTTSVATGVWALNEVQRAVLGGTWPSAVIVDPYFEYNTLLLHGNGTNGAQNNTFLDSSTNAFGVTRNGNTTQGTFTPYGDNWSNSSFSGSNYLTYNPGSSAAFGTGDFTVEAWVFATDALSSGDNPYICDTRGGGGAWSFSWNYNGTSNPWQLAWANSSVLQSSTTMNINTWNHCAYVRSGTTGTLYLNGVSIGTWTDNYNYSASVTSVTIGRRNSLSTGTQYLPGYLSNFRIVKGTAVYTAAFTPPTAPLTAITNTVLLTCQSNRFIDNSSSAYAITVNGSPSVQRFSPFNPTAPYSAATIGGSGYFDGSGDFLSLAANSAFDITSGDFTVEAWILRTASGVEQYLFSNRLDSPSSQGWEFRINATNLLSFFFTGGSIITSSGTVPANAWTHVAVSRQTNTVRLFINGVLDSSATFSNGTPASGTGLYLGYGILGGGYLTGYMSSARIVKGTAVYTSGFTPNTAPLSAVSGTSLLLNFTNGGIIDNAMMNDLETVGNAQISTSVSKFGGGSMAFDGTDDRLTAPASPNLAFNTGDFTVEGWIYTGSTGNLGVFQISGTSGGLQANQTNNTAVYCNNLVLGAYYGGTFKTGTTPIVANTWTHFALVRSSSVTQLYVNGVLDGGFGSNSDTQNYTGQNICVGGYFGTSNLFNGNIDEFRVTRGYARYTANFTPPTLPFPDQ